MHINLSISHYRQCSNFNRTNLSILFFPPDGVAGDVCPAGSHCPLGSAAPVACNPGSYSNYTGAAVCNVNPAGSYCVDGASAPPCPQGHYCPQGTGAATLPCPQVGLVLGFILLALLKSL